MTFAAVLNILFAIIGGKFFGVGGIIAATGIARLLTTFWYEPKYLYKDAFSMPYKLYWKHTVCYLVQSLIVIGVCVLVIETLPASIPMLFVKVFICLLVSTIVFFIMNIKTKEGKILIVKIKSIINKGGK